MLERHSIEPYKNIISLDLNSYVGSIKDISWPYQRNCQSMDNDDPFSQHIYYKLSNVLIELVFAPTKNDRNAGWQDGRT